MKISSTIGFEKRHNAALAIADEHEFVATALAGLGPQPPNFEAIVELNRGPLLTDGVELLPLAPRQVEQKRTADALLVDVRTDQQFDDAHIPDAISIPMLNAGFGSKLAWLADREQEIVFIGRDDEDGRRAGRLAVAVGIRRLAGFLGGGMTSWRQERRPVERIERLALSALPERAGEVQILDVRERSEWDDGHIPGSAHRAVARHRRAAGRPRPAAADRRRVRVRSARRSRRQPRQATRRRARDPRDRRRRAGLGRARSAAGVVDDASWFCEADPGRGYG